MEWDFLFFFNSGLLGVGLAMDAFSVSMANGLHDPKMSVRRMCIIAGTFGVFQAVMPMTGWVCVHTIVELFSSFEMFIPWIALILLAYIGGKMLLEGIRGEETEEAIELSAGALFVQGVATSIDALSVGFTISEYDWTMALAAAVIIAAVTFVLCMAGLHIGKQFGTKLQGIHSGRRHPHRHRSGDLPHRRPLTETFSLSLVFVKNLSYMRRSTAPCIFGTVAKKCRVPLEELLCFLPVRAQFLRL